MRPSWFFLFYHKTKVREMGEIDPDSEEVLKWDVWKARETSVINLKENLPFPK